VTDHRVCAALHTPFPVEDPLKRSLQDFLCRLTKLIKNTPMCAMRVLLSVKKHNDILLEHDAELDTLQGKTS
jgi:hypothetical protein